MDIQALYSFYQQHPVITTDSRNCPEGSIFFALKGENFDGNKFAVAALEKGCSLAVVDDEQTHARFSPTPGKQMCLVPNVLQTFKDLAREHRRRFNIPVVGITGTNGKTTTKELVRTVLAAKYNVMATEGNFNNDVGVPKTLFRLTPEHEIAVVEMGASHPGDIKTLALTAEPTCGLITNVGKAHLQGFGSLQGVINTKGELYDFLATRDDSLIFVNADNEHLNGILPADVKTLAYSQHPDNKQAHIVGRLVACDPFLRFAWRVNEEGAAWHEVATHLIGSYNLDNALAAITVGCRFGVEHNLIDKAIESYEPSNNRSQLVNTLANHLIVDAYNANPTSMEAALNNFAIMQVAPKMAIVGEMRELGAGSREEHEKLVATLLRHNFDKVWLVGHEFDNIDCPFSKFANVDEVKAALAADKPAGYHILIKGSNGTRLFQLPELL